MNQLSRSSFLFHLSFTALVISIFQYEAIWANPTKKTTPVIVLKGKEKKLSLKDRIQKKKNQIKNKKKELEKITQKRSLEKNKIEQIKKKIKSLRGQNKTAKKSKLRKKLARKRAQFKNKNKHWAANEKQLRSSLKELNKKRDELVAISEKKRKNKVMTRVLKKRIRQQTIKAKQKKR